MHCTECQNPINQMQHSTEAEKLGVQKSGPDPGNLVRGGAQWQVGDLAVERAIFSNAL